MNFTENREPPQHCDLILRGGTVIDGSGAPRFAADVAIAGDGIVAIGELGRMVAAHEFDVSGRVVAPGFIDVHTHDDRALLSQPDMAPKASQGVTSVVAGNCGVSLAPLVLTAWPPGPLDMLGDQAEYRFDAFGDYVEALEERPPAINAALLVGHITLRFGAMDDTARTARDSEIEAMRAGVAEAMAAGAVGFSTGLDYEASMKSSTEEVIALAEIAGEHGGVYTCHHRNYFGDVGAALDEAFTIGSRAGLPLVISHHQVSGRDNFGKSGATLAQIEVARRTQSVALDAYPYAASSKGLDPGRCKPGVRILVTWSEPHPEVAGRDLAAIAADWGLSEREAAERLLPAGAVYFQLDEADVRAILAYPETMIGSDGLPHDEHPHPRLWGAFPRVLGHYVRDVGLFPLEEAVRRMTSLPAAVFGFQGRGRIAAGAFADLVVFDPETIADRATFERPIQASRGIDLVLVNGEVVWRDGASTGARPGRVLRRTASIDGADGRDGNRA